MRRPFLHFFRQQMRGKCACKHVPLQIDISESAFFALLIYQLLFEQKNEDSLCCSFTMYPTGQNSAWKCLQIYCKIAVPPAQRAVFSMQNVEVYKLHSFSAEVYSFQQRRQFPFKNKSNICSFLSCKSAICIFLFARAFAIIIVYNGVCAEPPFTDDVFTF